MTDIGGRREEYETEGIDVGDLDPDPIAQWWVWYRQAVDAGCVEPNAMVLATVDAEGFPQARYLLARGVDARARGVDATLGERARRGNLHRSEL